LRRGRKGSILASVLLAIAGFFSLIMSPFAAHRAAEPQPAAAIAAPQEHAAASTTAAALSSATPAVPAAPASQPAGALVPGFVPGTAAAAQSQRSDAVTHTELDAAMSEVLSQIARLSAGGGFSGPSASTPVSFATFAQSQRIDRLSGTILSGISVDGVSGLTDADLPDDLTASNYLPLTGGSVEGDLNVSGTLSAGALLVTALSSSGALTGPYLSATSTDATSTFAGGVSVTGYASFATTTITGGLTVNGNTNITEGGQLTVGDKIIAPGEIGLGTSTPAAKLAVQSTDPLQTAFLIYATTTQASPLIDIFSSGNESLFTITASGRVGIGSSTPWSRLSVLNTDTQPQFTLAYDQERYAQLYVDASGDLTLSAAGGNVRLPDGNFFACAG
jgi:hypothetical protein